MAETILITNADVQSYRRIDPNFETTRFNSFVMEIQRTNLRNLLGAAMYKDFFDKYPDGGVYDDLFNGKDYEYSGENIHYYGMIPILVYWWLALATREGELFLSNYGSVQFVENTQQNYQIAKEKERAATGYMQTSQNYVNDLIQFVNENSSDYPFWTYNKERKGIDFLTFKI